MKERREINDYDKEGEAVVVIPFKVMMNSGKMKVTQLGEAILAQSILFFPLSPFPLSSLLSLPL